MDGQFFAYRKRAGSRTVGNVDSSLIRFRHPFRKKIPMASAKTMQVLSNAALSAIGACVKAHITMA